MIGRLLFSLRVELGQLLFALQAGLGQTWASRPQTKSRRYLPKRMKR